MAWVFGWKVLMTQDLGLRISKPGDDVKTVADKELVYSTKYSMLKIFLQNTLSITTNGSGNGSGSVAHGLTFAPAHLVFRKCTAQWNFFAATTYSNSYVPVGQPNPWGGYDDALEIPKGNFSAWTDATNLNVQISGADASTTYEFKYYILLDLTGNFTGSNPAITDQDWGLRISKPGIDVKTAKEFELAYSSKYKALQYFDVSQKKQAITLPAIAASRMDTYVMEGTYIDFNHGFGYPPLYMVYYSSNLSGTFSFLIEAPDYSENSIDIPNRYVACFADATRVRVSFNRVAAQSITSYDSLPEETITVRVFIFAEDLSA